MPWVSINKGPPQAATLTTSQPDARYDADHPVRWSITIPGHTLTSDEVVHLLVWDDNSDASAGVGITEAAGKDTQIRGVGPLTTCLHDTVETVIIADPTTGNTSRVEACVCGRFTKLPSDVPADPASTHIVVSETTRVDGPRPRRSRLRRALAFVGRHIPAAITLALLVLLVAGMPAWTVWDGMVYPFAHIVGCFFAFYIAVFCYMAREARLKIQRHERDTT